MTISSLDLNKIRIFLQIIEAGNLTKAATVLNERKSKLSRDLAALEADLKIQLVYRTTRQFQLTDAGKEFYRRAKDALLNLNHAVEDMSSNSTELAGVIRITASEDIGNYVLNPILADFKEKYPKVLFDLIYTNQVLDLTAAAIDVAVRIGTMKDSSLLQRKIGHIDSVLVATPEFIDRYLDLNNIENLSEVPAVVFGNKSKKVFWNLMFGKEKKRIAIKPSWMANNFVTVRDCVLRSQGVGFMPKFLVKAEIQSGQLVHIFKNWSDLPVPLQLVFPGQNEMSTRIKIFSDYAVKRLRETF